MNRRDLLKGLLAGAVLVATPTTARAHHRPWHEHSKPTPDPTPEPSGPTAGFGSARFGTSTFGGS